MIGQYDPIWAEKKAAVAEVLQPIFDDPNRLASFSGYHQIEREITDRGITRGQAIDVFRKMKAGNKYTEVIDKIEAAKTGGAPVEMQRLTVKLSDF